MSAIRKVYISTLFLDYSHIKAASMTQEIAAGNGDFLSVVSVPAAFDMGHCKAFLDTCAPCIVSLENQDQKSLQSGG
jgi:hypothetical protein